MYCIVLMSGHGQHIFRVCTCYYWILDSISATFVVVPTQLGQTWYWNIDYFLGVYTLSHNVYYIALPNGDYYGD